MYKKIISCLTVLIAAILIPALLPACSSDSGGQNNQNNQNENIAGDNNNNESGGTNEEETPADDRWQEIVPDYLPDADYEGYEFNVLVRSSNELHWAPWEARDIYAEAETGEPINDAVYRRNREIEGKYNFVLTESKRTDHPTALRNSINANDDIYDLYYAGFNDITGVATSGFFHNLFEVPNIDLSMPWWDQNARDSLSMANMLFLCTSDLILLHNDSTSAIVFNKQLIQDYSMEDPYQLVKDGKWTIDQVISMSKDISYDVNGDAVMDEYDMYGYVHYRDSSLSLMHGAGGRIAQKDSNDLPVLTLNSEIAIDALNKAFDLMYAPSAFNVHKELEGRYDAIYLVSHQIFMENRSLFYWILLHDIVSFRDMDSDFGILPIPKFSEQQADYGNTVNQYHGYAVAIPTTVQNIERTSVILEALTAKSRYTVLPAYYDISLQRKFTRDEDSAAMLDIIFNSQVYDVGAIYNFGGYSWNIIWMTMSHDRNIVTLFERGERVALRDIDRIVERYVEMSGN